MSRLLRVGTAVLCTVLAWLLPLPRAAAATTGQVQGLVLDPAGLPVDGARVAVVGGGVMGAVEAVADVDGAYRIGAVPPGTYVVQVTASAFREIHVEKVLVRVGGSTRVDVVLEPPMATQRGPLVVEWQQGAVDTEATGTGLSLGRDFLARTPNPRIYGLLPSLVPGGQEAPASGEIAAPGTSLLNGAGPLQNRWLLDGFDITDPLTRLPQRQFNFDMLEDVAVMTGGRSVEHGDAQGGVVSMASRRGGNAFFVDASLYATPDLWAANRSSVLQDGSFAVPPGLAPFSARESGSHGWGGLVNVNVGGPIIRDRLWFTVSNQLSFAQDELFSRTVGTRVAPRQVRSWAGLARLTWRPVDWQEFDVLIQGDPSVLANALQDARVGVDAEVQRHQGGSLVGFTSTTRIMERVRLVNRVGMYSAYTQDLPASGDGTRAGRLDTVLGTVDGNALFTRRDVRNRLQLSPQVVVDWSWLGGGHQTRAGADVMVSWMRWTEDANGGAVYRDVLGQPAERVVWDRPRQGWANGDQVGLYVEDTWKPIRSVTVRPGIRLDSARWRNDRMTGPATGPFDDAQDALRRESRALESILDATVAQFNVLSPRLAVAWDPFNDGKTNLHASLARYADTGWLAVPARTSAGAPTRAERWDAASGTWVASGDAPAASVADPGMRGLDVRHLPRSREDVDLRRPWAPRVGGADPLQLLTGHHVPHTDELILGITREVLPSVSFTANGIVRAGNNQFEDVEQNLVFAPGGQDALGGRNGIRQAVWNVGTPDRAYGLYYGFELLLHKRLVENFEGLVHYTFGVNRGTTGSAFTSALDNPSQPGNPHGYLPQDRRHMLRVLGSYRLPWGFGIGGNVAWLSGQPYSATRFNTALQGTDLVGPRGMDPAVPGRELRMPDTLFTSARATWNTRGVTGLDLQLIGDVTNVLNLRGVTAVDTRAGATLGQSTATQAPVQFTLGARFQY